VTDGEGRAPAYPLSPRVRVVNLGIGFEELWRLSFLRKIPVYLRKQRLFRQKMEATLRDLRPDITVSTLRREINFLTALGDGSRKVGELHVCRSHYRNFEEGDSNAVKSLFARLWMGSLVRKLKRLDRFVVLTHEDRACWPELERVSVIPNPLDFDSERKADPAAHRVIAAGRYVYQKGFGPAHRGLEPPLRPVSRLGSCTSMARETRLPSRPWPNGCMPPASIWRIPPQRLWTSISRAVCLC